MRSKPRCDSIYSTCMCTYAYDFRLAGFKVVIRATNEYRRELGLFYSDERKLPKKISIIVLGERLVDSFALSDGEKRDTTIIRFFYRLLPCFCCFPLPFVSDNFHGCCTYYVTAVHSLCKVGRSCRAVHSGHSAVPIPGI